MHCVLGWPSPTFTVAWKICLLDCSLQALHPGPPKTCFCCEIASFLKSFQVRCKVKVSLLELLVEAGLDAVKHALQLIGIKVMIFVVGCTKWVHKKGEPELTF